MPGHAAFVIERADRLPPPPPGALAPPRADAYQLLSALVEQRHQLEAELDAARWRFRGPADGAVTLAHDAHQPPAAQHVASVIERQLAHVLGADGP